MAFCLWRCFRHFLILIVYFGVGDCPARANDYPHWKLVEQLLLQDVVCIYKQGRSQTCLAEWSHLKDQDENQTCLAPISRKIIISEIIIIVEKGWLVSIDGWGEMSDITEPTQSFPLRLAVCKSPNLHIHICCLQIYICFCKFASVSAHLHMFLQNCICFCKTTSVSAHLHLFLHT